MFRSKKSHSLPFQIISILNSSNSSHGPFQILTFWTIPEILHTGPFQNFYIIDNSRIFNLVTIPLISHCGLFLFFHIPDCLRIFTSLTIVDDSRFCRPTGFYFYFCMYVRAYICTSDRTYVRTSPH